MRAQAKHRGTGQLYVYGNYNVQGIFPANFYAQRSILARMLNTVIYGLNKFEKLPRMLVMIPDKNLIEAVDNKRSGISLTMGMCLEWLIRQIEKAIDRKKNMMREIKPGSVIVGEPKMIWIKMIKRPNNEELLCLREKFNEILEDILATRRDSYIMSAEEFLDNSNFSRLNDLTVTGREHYWKAVDSLIMKFDKQMVSLKPQASNFN